MEAKPNPSFPVNYFYFGGLFIALVFLIAGSIFTKENLSGSQFFFFLYALGQVILETMIFIFLGSLTLRFFGKFSFALFISLTFLILILHSIDFMMDRMLDLSIWETMKAFIIDETFENFLYLLDASGVPLLVWALLFLSLAALPFLGFLLYKMSDLIALKKPLEMRQGWFWQAFVCVPCALLFWDFSASKMIHPDAYTAFIKSLPWKMTFLQPQNVILSLPGPVPSPPNESDLRVQIERDQTVLTHKPNIYLFIVESLREDCMTAEAAPHLTQFKKESHHFDLALSNANASHISWFSIFHSQLPHLWRKMQSQKWQMGSPALQLLKKWGYQIRLYSSAQLGYYGMEELLFGKEMHLIDVRQTFHHIPPLEAAETDAAALKKLQQDMAEDPSLKQGQVFIVFWDCTHFDYSWPKNWSPKFTPFAQETAYFRAFHSQKNINLIKNRYRNAIHYMDSLFGNFMDFLPNKEEAVVIFSADHGEEFFEHGHLFHGSHLTHEQTNVPIYFKFGRGERPIIERSLISQMDIFPSLIDYLKGSPVSFLKGNSLFAEPVHPYVMTARFNAGRAPYEFSLHNGKHKLIAQSLNRRDIFLSKQLQILSMRSCNDKSIPECKKSVMGWVQREFGTSLNDLFQSE